MNLKGWRTVAVNTAMMLTIIIPPIQDWLVTTFENHPGWVAAIIAGLYTLANYVMRYLTDTPIGRSS